MEHYVFNYFNKPPCVIHVNHEPTMTQQQFKDECDINQILKKFVETGFLDTIGPGVFADISDTLDYQSSLNFIKQADEMFAALPSGIRERFHNNPAEYMDFVHDPSNLAEGQELGIFVKDTSIIQKTDTQTPPAETT